MGSDGWMGGGGQQKAYCKGEAEEESRGRGGDGWLERRRCGEGKEGEGGRGTHRATTKPASQPGSSLPGAVPPAGHALSIRSWQNEGGRELRKARRETSYPSVPFWSLWLQPPPPPAPPRRTHRPDLLITVCGSFLGSQDFSLGRPRAKEGRIFFLRLAGLLGCLAEGAKVGSQPLSPTHFPSWPSGRAVNDKKN